MKKHLVLTITVLLMLAALSAGCAKKVQSQAEQQPAEPAEVSASDPCDNIFYPLALNNQWVYRLNFDQAMTDEGSSDLALTVSEVSGSSAVLAALDYDTGIVIQSTVQCQDQAILNFPMTELNMVLGALAGNFEMTYQNGTFMPSEATFINSNWVGSWETNFTATGNLEGSYEGESISVNLSNSPVKMNWQVVGTGESMTVAAGTFDNLVKIERNISIDVTSLQAVIEGNPINMSTTLKIGMDMWYAPHIGMIKQEIKSVSAKVLGIDFPIDVQGSIDLSSYNIIS